MNNQKLKTNNLSILDLGSGEGGTASVFSINNFVVSLDLSLIRLQKQKEIVIPKKSFSLTEESCQNNTEDFSVEDSFKKNNNFVNGTALQLSFSNHSFDLIIIQDVIEHLTDTKSFINEIKRVLKQNGIIYLSTPNKLSCFNNIFHDDYF